MRNQLDNNEPMLPRSPQTAWRFEKGITSAEYAVSPKDDLLSVYISMQ